MIGYFDGDYFNHFTKLEEFLAFIFVQEKVNKIYAHNGGGFDFMFLMKKILDLPFLSVENIIPRGSGILCFDVVDQSSSEQRKITFSDSLAILPFTLRSLCKDFKVSYQKLEIDYDTTKTVTQKLIRYNEHDCRGLFEVIQKYREWPLIQQAGPKDTMASQAMQVLRLFLKDKIHALDYDGGNPEGADTFVRRAYFGGRTEVFKPLYKGKKPIAIFDVNSLYPHCMKMCNDFPSKFLYFTDSYEKDSIGFFDAVVDVPYNMYVPPLGIVHGVNGGNKYIFPTGRFKGRFSTIELEYARSVGVKIVKTGDGIVFGNGGPIFKDFISHLYDLRMNAPKDSPTNVLAKLLMNSCYGRFGLNRDRENLVIDHGQNNVQADYMLDSKLGVVRLVREPRVLETSFTNVAIAAWVTSLARIYMHKIYMKAPEELYYTDTDSLFTTYEYQNSSELGGLKLEYTAKSACFLLPKTYIVDGIEGLIDKDTGKPITTKWVMKGFDKKKIKHFTVDDFTTALEGEMRVLKAEMDMNGIARFKSALRKGDLLCKRLEMKKHVAVKGDTLKALAPVLLCAARTRADLAMYNPELAMREPRVGEIVLYPPTRQIRAQYDKRSIFKENGLYDTKPLHISLEGKVENAPKPPDLKEMRPGVEYIDDAGPNSVSVTEISE